MSVDNIFSFEMYHNEQWCMIDSRAVNPPFLAGRLLVLKAASLPPYFKRNLPVFENK